MVTRMENQVFILFRDDHLVVVHKPAGMLVHRGMMAPRSEQFLLQTVRDLVGRPVYPVHRLDRPTGGLVVFGLSSQVAHVLQQSWQQGQVQKHYQAIVRGWMPEPQGFVDISLDDPDSGILHEARTKWQCLEQIVVPIAVGKYSEMRLSLLDMEPITGRYHQLRRHMSRLHHPILGDTTHGDRHHNHAIQSHLGWWKLMLWAYRLQFPHPVTGMIMVVEDAKERGLAPYWEILANKK